MGPKSRATVRVFSDDGKCVHDPLLMRRALEYVSTFDGVIAQHAQERRRGAAGGVTGRLVNGVGLLSGSLRPSWTIKRSKKSPG